MQDADVATGSDGLPIGRGDVIQTRKNDPKTGVVNRAVWTVQEVGVDGTLWVRRVDSDRHAATVKLDPEYVAEHTHLAYASTAYGVQGSTKQTAHTVLTDSLGAAGLYVGMTRGRERNQLHIVATDYADARAQYVDAATRDRADRGLTAATERARQEVAGVAPRVALTAEEQAILADYDTTLERFEQRVMRQRELWAERDAITEQIRELAKQKQQAEAVLENAEQVTDERISEITEAVDVRSAEALRDAELTAKTWEAAQGGMLRRAARQNEAEQTRRELYGKWGVEFDPAEQTATEWVEARRQEWFTQAVDADPDLYRIRQAQEVVERAEQKARTLRAEMPEPEQPRDVIEKSARWVDQQRSLPERERLEAAREDREQADPMRTPVVRADNRRRDIDDVLNRLRRDRDQGRELGY